MPIGDVSFETAGVSGAVEGMCHVLAPEVSQLTAASLSIFCCAFCLGLDILGSHELQRYPCGYRFKGA